MSAKFEMFIQKLFVLDVKLYWLICRLNVGSKKNEHQSLGSGFLECLFN